MRFLRPALIALLIGCFAAPWVLAASSVSGLNCYGALNVKTSGGATKFTVAQATGNLAINTDKFAIAGATGALTWIPSTITTTDVFTMTMAGLTTGTGLLLKTDDSMAAGYYIETKGGASYANTPWTLGLDGAAIWTPTTVTTIPVYVDGSALTTGDFIKLKAVDATLNGGLYLNCLGLTGTTAVFTVAEDGVTTIGAVGAGVSGSVAIKGLTSGGITIAPIDAGTNTTTIQNASGGSAKVITLPSATCTLPGLELANTWTAVNTGPGGGTQVYTKQVLPATATVAAVHSVLTVVAAPAASRTLRLVGYRVIACGGTTATMAHIYIKGTRSAGPVTLVDIPVANLTRSVLCGTNTANNVILADGASFTALDAATAITVSDDAQTTGATGFLIEILYAVD